ncbi:MAG TPA: MFS transporter [Candidatus Didemnitutus sp.]|nr:MFS transporter [Candidatus Didemnitutus sp.]
MSHPTPTAPWWRTLTRAQWLVFAVASLAWLFDCLDLQFFNLARDAAVFDFVGDRAQATVLGPYTTSMMLVGWSIGGLIFGALGDRLGRARILTVCILFYSIGTGLSAFAGGFPAYCAFRLLTGFGVGGVFGLAVALVTDSVSDAARPPALGLLQSLSTCGNILAGFIGMGVGAWALHPGLPFGLKAWQALSLIGALPAFLCAVIITRVPEPEKWQRARSEAGGRGIRFGSYAALLGHSRWARHAWFGLAVCCAGVVGVWGVGNFYPEIVGDVVRRHLAARSLPPGELASEVAYWRSAGLLLQNIGGFAGMLTLSWLAQTRGRKLACAGALVASFLATLAVFRGLREFDQIFWMLPLMGFGQLGVLAVFAVYLPELFPQSLRGTGTSFCYNFGRLIAATAPFTLSRITASLGGDLDAFRAAGQWVNLVLLLGLVPLLFLPETRGQPLPQD